MIFVLSLAAVMTACSSLAPAAGPQLASHCVSPSEKGRWNPEFSPLESLAGRIDQLGSSRYTSTYAGVQLFHGARQLVVYVVPGHAAAFLRAAAAADSRHLCYAVKNVKRSYAAQAQVSSWIAAHAGAIRQEGMPLLYWGPFPAEDAVQVVMQSPSSHILAQLRAAVARVRAGYLRKRPLNLQKKTPVTLDTYGRVAAAVLNAEAPSPDIVVHMRLPGSVSRRP
jgi:hypothetical protein